MEDESELLALRRARLETWREMGIDPFGGAFPGAETCRQAVENYADERPVRIAGRLISKREMGKNVFAHIQDETGKLQVYAQVQGLGDKFGYWKLLDIGDFIGGEGTLFTTKTGEKTVRLSDLKILSKSLRPIPSQWYGLADVEQRYRQRYVDLIVNEEARKVLLLRGGIVREIRRFFEERDFIEVETPMMQTVAGGAAARPFVTRHNALGIDLYMRIAPELYLKRLLVGGMGKVFEINRNFRNEGVSRRHNPEFTMLEAYWAYADFEAMARLVEDLITTVSQKVMGTLHVGGHAAGEDGTVAALPPIDLTPPWPRKPYRELVKAAAGDDWFAISAEDRRERCGKLGVEITPAMEDFEVTNQVFEKLVEAKTRNPLFVTHLPKELVPLARQNDADPSVVDVFELIIGGQEISPGYSELNDPVVQRERLQRQAGEERQKLDEDFLAALEYGMPPAGGIGIGIDRLVMTLTGAESIRDVIFFPLLKPKA
ncbi:MAG TPA: lysine--tRNA ligase [Candidatus Methylacidiphilales bacterium]|jgi:lysyl-tRNA synthetase class 2|nr:lysine--tRNA ligase [Candidatus Methylacidiphilales bacterium]